MKKTFSLTHDKIKIDRLAEAVKHDVKKYIKRESKKTLPETADFWDFDCKYGATEKEAKKIHVKEINKYIDKSVELTLESFYLEILAKPRKRLKKEKTDVEADSAD